MIHCGVPGDSSDDDNDETNHESDARDDENSEDKVFNLNTSDFRAGILSIL